MTKIKSPCTGHCSHKNGICYGCNLSIDEIAGWNSSPDEHKQLILKRAERRKVALGEINVKDST